MSDRVNIPVSLLKDKRISLSDVRVYAVLAQCADEKQQCSSTVKKIQQISGVQRVSRHSQNLSQYGYIRLDKVGEGNRNIYTLLDGADEMKSTQQITLETFSKEYLQYSSGVHTSKTYLTYRSTFREFLKVEGDRNLHSIGIREIEHFLSVKRGEGHEWSARKYYIALSSAFEKAVQWELLKENPFRKVKKPRPPEVIPVYLNDKDFQRFLSVIEDNDFRELCIIGLLTGLRLGELISLRWKDIDFLSKVILVQNSETFTTKTRRNRVVSMSENALMLLKERKENVRFECETVFYDEKGKALKEGTVSQKFKRTIRRAGLNDRIHFHSLRHSFASGLVTSGVSLYAVQKLLGHTTSKTTEIYSHLLPQQLHKEVNILSGMFNLKRGNDN